MSFTLGLIQSLVARGELKVSLYGYEELENDAIRVRDAVSGLSTAVVVEDYPTYSKGPCVLVLQRDGDGQPDSYSLGYTRRPRGASRPGDRISSGS